MAGSSLAVSFAGADCFADGQAVNESAALLQTHDALVGPIAIPEAAAAHLFAHMPAAFRCQEHLRQIAWSQTSRCRRAMACAVSSKPLTLHCSLHLAPPACAECAHGNTHTYQCDSGLCVPDSISVHAGRATITLRAHKRSHKASSPVRTTWGARAERPWSSTSMAATPALPRKPCSSLRMRSHCAG